MLISPGYAGLNRELHEREPYYGTSGHKWAETVNRLARQLGARSVLDYGCGKGLLKEALMPVARLGEPYEILEYDPAVAGKEERPSQADLVVCGDVLEHIEPECLYAVLDDIRNIARLAVLLVVATRPAKKILSDGRNAHLIVEPVEWWLPKLALRWRVKLLQDIGGEFMMIGGTR